MAWPGGRRPSESSRRSPSRAALPRARRPREKPSSGVTTPSTGTGKSGAGRAGGSAVAAADGGAGLVRAGAVADGAGEGELRPFGARGRPAAQNGRKRARTKAPPEKLLHEATRSSLGTTVWEQAVRLPRPPKVPDSAPETRPTPVPVCARCRQFPSTEEIGGAGRSTHPRIPMLGRQRPEERPCTSC